MKNIVLIFILMNAIGVHAYGQQKRHYSIFKPAPVDSLREMETDRPDVTESPQTVDAGHFQLETDLMRFQRQRNNEERTDEYRSKYKSTERRVKESCLLILRYLLHSTFLVHLFFFSPLLSPALHCEKK